MRNWEIPHISRVTTTCIISKESKNIIKYHLEVTQTTINGICGNFIHPSSEIVNIITFDH